MADGRHGVEKLAGPPRLVLGCRHGPGTPRPYYFAHITLVGNKSLANFSSNPFDHLVGQSLLVKDVEELVSAYHPGLRSFIAGQSRGSIEFYLGRQDGMQHVMNTLSKSGTERDTDLVKFPDGYDRLGEDAPPDLVAELTMTQPWAPDWVSTMVDDKPLPYEVAGTAWNGLKRCYLGENYGLASCESSGRPASKAWRNGGGKPSRCSTPRKSGFLDMRYTMNVPRFRVNADQGRLDPIGDVTCLAKQEPHDCHDEASYVNVQAGYLENPVTSMQSSIGLFTIQDGGPTYGRSSSMASR